jgi:hypothetical protein
MNYDTAKQATWANGPEVTPRNNYLGQANLGPQPGLVSERVEGGVIRSVRRMEKQLMELSATVETLCERLSMVRIPCPSSTQGVDKAPEGSSLATQLSAYNQVLECQTARLQQLIQELDL